MKIALTVLILFGAMCYTYATSFDFRGQLSTRMGYSRSTETLQLYGIRYIPSAELGFNFGSGFLDCELSLNAFHSGQFQKLTEVDSDNDITPYRAWIRFSAAQFELRAGLQKINFGSAVLFRPLMWFDAIDPRDPLQITDGVYAMLARYYFLNNTNIWIWGLYGNTDLKGWEFYQTVKDVPEFGGRFQVPILNGEFGLTYHHRRIKFDTFTFPIMSKIGHEAEENRIALDGKWNLELGFWFEYTLTHQNTDLLIYDWRSAFTVGSDYTFDIGNGLTILGEYFQLENSEEAFKSGQSIKFTAGSFNYPIGLLDRVEGILYYDWENDSFYRFFNWRRTYDHWSFHLMVFWNPDQYQLYQSQAGNNLFTGKGFQLMAVFNH
jgi:hypothetical protein